MINMAKWSFRCHLPMVDTETFPKVEYNDLYNQSIGNHVLQPFTIAIVNVELLKTNISSSTTQFRKRLEKNHRNSRIEVKNV